ITALEDVTEPEMIGTSGSIVNVMRDDEGNVRLLVEGSAMSKFSQEKIVLNLSKKTIITDLAGNQVEVENLTKDTKVLAYYGPMLAKSLPPIGRAWKIVLLSE